MSTPHVIICLVVMNGEKYIRHCLDAVKKQSYRNFDLIIWNNGSDDRTVEIAEKSLENWSGAWSLISNTKNYGLGGGFNRAAERASGEYVVGLCVDVLLDKDFLKNSIERMESDKKIGALQAKIFQWDYSLSLRGAKRRGNLEIGNPKHGFTSVIDTVGMSIDRARRIVNIGHGEKDEGQYETSGEIFSYEGACPVFRKKALVETQIPRTDGDGFEYLDEDFFWYADDIDLGWRMRLLGWKNYYDPKVKAWHDRSTTKATAGSRSEFVAMRRTIPAHKRRLDWQNQINAFIKNDSFSTPLPFASRQLQLLGYFLLYERTSLPGIWHVIKQYPIMKRKRAYIKNQDEYSKFDKY